MAERRKKPFQSFEDLAARQRAKQNYSIEAIVSSFEPLYKKLLKEQPAKK